MSAQPFRLKEGGRIDRRRELGFAFDGRKLTGHPGDTLASALLANGVRLVGRSFKYHRPRGILSAGPEEPNALVHLGSGARLEPNMRATMIELKDGLEATSQNRWPSLGLDLMAATRPFASLLPAGFYYKTFMWPRRFWRNVYEPSIRRAAGLGAAPSEPDPDAYAKVHAHCDVLVVGGGPAGLSAALAAGRGGARVILADERSELGGSLLSDARLIDGAPAAHWVEEMRAELALLPDVRLLGRTTVFGYYDHNVLGAIERVTDHLATPAAGLPRQRLWIIRARRVILATGAIERPLTFTGNDLPGVMLASAVLAYLNRYAVVPGRRAVVFTNNDDGYRTALDLHAAGIEVAAVVDPRPELAGELARQARERGLDCCPGHVVARATGGRSLRGVDILPLARGMPLNAARREPCDLLAMSGGFDPALHLHSQAGAKPVYDLKIAALRPSEAAQAEWVIGAAAGDFQLAACLSDGLAAGAEAARLCGFPAKEMAATTTDDVEEAPIMPLWRVPEPDRKKPGKAFVDFQNDVTAADVALAAREGYVSIEHAKRYTTLGMATDQGKSGNLNGLGLLAEARGVPIAALGTTTFRPPYTPVAIGALAGHERGRHYQPIRRTALHGWHERAGAVFTEAGHWLRPQYYPRPGESMDEAIKREVETVRQAAGLVDVSTLGKIDLQGPDAAAFLDRLYVNAFSTLKPGRARYGLMLREDGIAFDDGTTSCLAPGRYFMTTTTAHAASVLQHMEFHHQVVWPELDVSFASVTDQWCAIALAGPRSREVLAAVVGNVEVSNEALPYMGVAEAALCGIPARIFRISFSGELAYEINVPAGYGELVWQALMKAGAPFGIAPYGTEAMGIMRLEKGHVAGPEIDGRTTARDLGLARMVSGRKDFIGRRLTERPGLADPERPQLVGLVPGERAERLRAGAHLLPPDAELRAGLAQGHVSSIGYSPTLGHFIALGFLRRGPDRIGERLDAVYPLKDERVAVEVRHPVFVDPEGTRLRA
jgi:methylglutamate dehydrogenase subunit C